VLESIEPSIIRCLLLRDRDMLAFKLPDSGQTVFALVEFLPNGERKPNQSGKAKRGAQSKFPENLSASAKPIDVAIQTAKEFAKGEAKQAEKISRAEIMNASHSR